MQYYSDLDEEIYFALWDENNKSKEILTFLTRAFGREFEEIDDDWADDYNFETDTLLIKANLFNEDILELIEDGVEIHII